MVNTRSSSIGRRIISTADSPMRNSSTQTTPRTCCRRCNYNSNTKRRILGRYNVIAVSFIMLTVAIIIYIFSEYVMRSDNRTPLSTLTAKQNSYTKSTKENVFLDSKERDLKNAIRKYDADKTGKCDYALESLGGKILHTGSTETFNEPKNSLFCPIFSYLGYTFCSPYRAASVILQPRVLPGDCWAFVGSKGTATIQLYGNIFVTGMTLEHIPVSISPTREISSAPKKFSITGLMSEDNDAPGVNLGTFLYDIHDQENPVQYFEIPNEYEISFRVVRIDIYSNWGNELFTCVYRIRIHGNLDKF